MPSALKHRMKYFFYRYQEIPCWIKHVWLTICLGTIIINSSNTYAHEIAILKSSEIRAYTIAIEAFREALPSSFQVTLEYDLQGDTTKGRNLARKIRASNANLVLAVGLKAALAAKLEILDIPVIVCLVLDPEKYGLPTSNMVGLSLHIPFEQQLKPLRALAPEISRIGVLFDPQKSQGLKDLLEQHAKPLGLTLVSEEVHSEQEVSDGLKVLIGKVEALYLLPDSTVLTENTLDFLISSTLEANILPIGFSAGLVRSGAVTGVYLNYADLGRQAATLVPRMLSSRTSLMFGTMLPPNVVHQAINVKSARYLGLPLNSTILRSFDEQY